MYRELNIKKKTGFRIVRPPVIIYDSRGYPFYVRMATQKPTGFNLPPGKYYVNTGLVEPLPAPVKYPDLREKNWLGLPKVERIVISDPGSFDIQFKPNPRVCTIYWKDKKIVFDTSFLNKPSHYYKFILFHEFGHKFYEDEHLTDIYAANEMLKNGYNPEQIIEAIQHTLNNQERKELLTKKLEPLV